MAKSPLAQQIRQTTSTTPHPQQAKEPSQIIPQIQIPYQQAASVK